MSLEEALNRNTAALEQLLAVLQNAPRVAAPEGIKADDVPVEEPAPKAKKYKKEAAPGPNPLEQTAPSLDAGATSALVTEAAAAPVAEQVTYTQLQDAVLTLIAQKGKPAAQAILAKHGLESFKHAKASQYADLKAEAEAAL